MPICRVIKISYHTKCWSGESPHCWAAVSRAPEFWPEFHDIITMQESGMTSDWWRRRQVLHDITSSVVCHSLFVTSRNSGLNSGALETAQQSKGMQRYQCAGSVVLGDAATTDVVKPNELRCAANASHDATSVEDVIWRAVECGRIRLASDFQANGGMW
jgi:hypothetical protein